MADLTGTKDSRRRMIALVCALIAWGVFRWLAPQGMWILLIGFFGLLTWVMVRHTHTDRAIHTIVMSSYVLHVVVALALFAISLWHVPIASHLQLGNGFWRFSGDAAYYHAGAEQLVSSWSTGIPVNRFFWERRFIVWVGLVYALLGSYPLNGVLVNVWLGSIIPVLGLQLLQLFTSNVRAHRLSVLLLAFWPSLFLWSTQLLKDPWLVAIILLVLKLLCELGTLSTRGELFRAKRLALKLLLAFSASLICMGLLRSYATLIFFGAFLVTTIIWLIMSFLVEQGVTISKRCQVLACFGVVAVIIRLGVSIGALDLLGMVTVEPSPLAWVNFGATASNTTNACLVELEQWVTRSPRDIKSQDPKQLTESVVHVVKNQLQWDQATVEKVDRPVLEQAAATMLREREAYLKASITHRFTTQVKSFTEHDVPQDVKYAGSTPSVVTMPRPVWSVFRRLNEKRLGYTTSGGALVVDQGVAIDTLGRFIHYIPRAIANAMFGPFPSQWKLGDAQSSCLVEVLLLYAISPLLVIALVKLWRVGGFNGWFLGSYIVLMQLLLGMVIANLGILFRLRLMFLIPWLAVLPLGIGGARVEPVARSFRTKPRLIWRPSLFVWLLLGAAIGLAWWPVVTRQGINGVVMSRRVPLWVKATRFVTRDSQCRRLAHAITKKVSGDQEKVMAIFEWTRAHLRHQPAELPIMDDHIYSIIERGYGIADQYADVFTTLCAYAGVPATMVKLSHPLDGKLYLAAVKLERRWCLLDPYRGVYFQHPDGRMVSIDELIRQPELLTATQRGAGTPPVNYGRFIHPGLDINVSSLRPYEQMPWSRLWREIVHRLMPFHSRFGMAAQ